MIIQTDVIENILTEQLCDVDTIKKALEVVMKYIKDKKSILYGGQALDYAFKAVGDVGIYKEGSLPDYDFISPFNYEDSIELFMLLRANSLDILSSINAFHATTRRVRVRMFPVADITYMPASILSTLPYVEYNGYRVVHPLYQRIDMHSSLSFPLDNPPNEVIRHRIKKDLTRLSKLDSLYPVVIDISPTFSRFEYVHENPDLIVTGFLAYAAYVQYYGELQKKFLRNPKFRTYDITLERDGNNYSYDAPEQLVSFVSVNDMDVSGFKTYRKQYMESRPLCASDGNREIHFVLNRVCVYNEYQGLKIVSFHHLCLYFIQAYHELRNDLYLVIYKSLLNMISNIRDIHETMFYFPFNSVGQSVPVSDYLSKMEYKNKQKKLALEEYSQVRVNPPNLYESGKGEDQPKWDYSTFIYQISGDECTYEEFRELLNVYVSFAE